MFLPALVKIDFSRGNNVSKFRMLALGLFHPCGQLLLLSQKSRLLGSRAFSEQVNQLRVPSSFLPPSGLFRRLFRNLERKPFDTITAVIGYSSPHFALLSTPGGTPLFESRKLGVLALHFRRKQADTLLYKLDLL